VIGIVLAGGNGTRLYPLTNAISKQLLPVYDKPMVYYPISTLMLAGISEIIIITTPSDLPNFKRLLGSGQQFGVTFHYIVQSSPEGLAHAFIVSEELIAGEKTALILGDNIFHGTALGTQLKSFQDVTGANIFGYRVSNPKEYGVAELDEFGRIIGIEEKPVFAKSNFAIPGLYFYDSTVIEKSKSIKKSPRGELEISSLNHLYLDEGKLNFQVLQRGTAWLDTGTFTNLHEASSYIQVLQERQGYKIGCPEEISLRNGWISREDLQIQVNKNISNEYFRYLGTILNEKF
jgi:glucose-1-phosphate thymidylyltransferase